MIVFVYTGARGYQAPEILLRGKEYDKKIDVFAMGVVLFILLGGYPLFEHARDSDKWYHFIVNTKYKNFWKSHRNCGLRQEETDLITRMICYDTPDDQCDPLLGSTAGLTCLTDYECIDDPTDDCDPNKGGAHCGGICNPTPGIISV